ncbi:MAG: hypothetical protein CR971_02210 [candidate division SR1 bacterium]|nr:MAG: hypothetical protein CR971_02210 [candidate division SR1 bacterium]
MDFKKILHFSKYEPLMDENPQFIVDRIIKKLNSYSQKDYSEIIQRTYDFTRHAHDGIYRHSGEAYITHPIQVADILMDLKPDVASVQTAILHDVIEDTEYNYDDISGLFGEEVATLCQGLVKIKKVKYKGEDTQLETIKKTFLAMAQDLRVILIKIADRIHNMQTLVYHPKIEKQEKIALETMKIYVPVCKRLGLYQYQTVLENLCFKILDPESFEKVFQYFEKHVPSSKKDSEKGVAILTKLLEKEGITDFTVKGRLKSPYRVYEKMTKKYQSWDFNKVMDLLAFRVITKNISDCYSVLGIMHKHYTPLINKIKDYIAIPKFNGYKSIHTTVMGMFRLPTEIQIRTKEMDNVAEFGVAAHFAYSDKNGPIAVNKKQSEWIKNLQNLVKEYTEREEGASEKREEFKKKLNVDILNKSTFLYTPKGDIIEISRGGTVLDFAFAVHTDIGLRFKHAIVNGSIVPINYIPKTGDIVDIKTFRNKYTATKHWMEFVHSPSSKAKITRYLRQNERTYLIETAKQTVNKQLEKLKLPSLYSKEDQLSQYYTHKDLENKLLDIIDKKTSITHLIKSVYPNSIKDTTPDKGEKKKQKNKSQYQYQDIIIDDHRMANFSLCPECNPQHSEKIIAKVDRHGIKIHKTGCIAMQTIHFDKLLEAHWGNESENSYLLNISFQIDTNINIIEIFSIISGLNMEIETFKVEKKEREKTKFKIMHLTILATNPTKIQYMINSLKKFGNSVKVLSKKLV